VIQCVDPFHLVANGAVDKARRWAWNEARRLRTPSPRRTGKVEPARGCNELVFVKHTPVGNGAPSQTCSSPVSVTTTGTLACQVADQPGSSLNRDFLLRGQSHGSRVDVPHQRIFGHPRASVQPSAPSRRRPTTIRLPDT
jgi:hypothetical protein